MGDPAELTATVAKSLAEIGRKNWENCLETSGNRLKNPFVGYDFLECLEASGCVSRRTGWLPQHIALRSAGGDVLAVMACYLKSHSFGEYVFDHAWADAFERAGGSYYPKLQAAVPFTPVTGPRLLVRPDVDRGRAEAALAGAAVELTRRLDASSLHLTFLPEAEWEHLGELGFLKRTGKQFHWPNPGYGSFDDFLAALASRKRKAIRKERERALEGGISVELLTGSDITEAHWDAFHRFYVDTGSRKWGTPYLNRKFFSLVGERMGGDILLIMAKRSGRHVAGALNFIGADTLFGRYWGALEHHEFLHFELCYYQAIEYAIATGMKTVEAGAQGPHKLARGYLPVTTYSAHYIAHRGLSDAVARFLDEERAYVEMEQEELAEHAPYRHGGGSPPE